MNVFHQLLASLPVVVPPATPPTRRRNTFRSVAVSFGPDEIRALPTVRRLIDLYQNRAMLCPAGRPAGEAYRLVVLNLLLPGSESPAEAGTVVMTMQQQKTLADFLRGELFRIVSERRSPFYDVAAPDVYLAILAILHVVENYTSVVPLLHP